MPTITTSITLDGHKCILTVPRGTKAEGKATSLTCPLGPAPTRGWVLLDRAGHAALGNGPLSLVWMVKTLGDGGGEVTTTFSGLYPISHGRQGFGGVGDAEAIFLVELVDGRYWAAHASDTGLLANNVRSYAQDNVEDGARSWLTGTAGKTWESVAASLWGSCPQLGNYPGLPFAPDWKPEGQRFIGANGFAALNALLDFLDCAIRHDVTTGGGYSIVQLGSNQAIPAHTSELKWDGEHRTFPTGLAGGVATYFPTHYLAYGQERDTELDGNWAAVDSMGEGFRYATTGGGAGVAGGMGTAARWQDLPRLIDKDLNDINAGRRTTRSNAVAGRYAARYGVQRVHRVFVGILNDLLPGGQIRVTQWRHLSEERGTETEFYAGPHLPRDTGGADLAAICDLQPTENYAGHDLGRHTYPNYPRLPNIVQIYNGGTPGTPVDPDGDGFHRGRVKRWVGGEMKTLEDCAIRFVDDHDNLDGQVKGVEGEYYGPARLTGIATDDNLPLYLVRRGGDAQDLIFFELTEDLDLDGSAEAEILTGDGGDGWAGTGNFIVVQDPYNTPGMWQAYTGYRGFARKHPGSELYDVVWMERIAQWVWYQLDEDLHKTDPMDPFNFECQAEASVVDYHDQGKNPGSPITVWHRDTQFLAWHVEGCLGWAHWSDRAKRYEITTPQLQCKFIQGTLKYDLCPDDEIDQQTIENATSYDQGYYSFKVVEFLDPREVDFENPRLHAGTAGKACLLMGYKPTDDATALTWELIDIELSEVNVVVNLIKPPGECVIRGNTQKIYVETCGVLGNDLNIPMDEVDVVVQSEYQSGTEEGVPYCRHVVTTLPVCVIATGVDPTTTVTNFQKVQPAANLAVSGTGTDKELTWDKLCMFVICTCDTETGTPIPIPNCCSDDCAACETYPTDIRLTFEDIDNALEGHPFYNPFNYIDGTNVGGSSYSGEATDSWGCDHDLSWDITCVDGVYTLHMSSADSDPWPGLAGGMDIPATSFTCDPFEIVFEFTSDVTEEMGCYSGKVDQHFRVTVTGL